jgi:hypothetical protein
VKWEGREVSTTVRVDFEGIIGIGYIWVRELKGPISSLMMNSAHFVLGFICVGWGLVKVMGRKTAILFL